MGKLRRQPTSGKPAATEPEPTGLRLMREFQELAREVPAEEWAKLPADLTDNLDHYLYGTPKKKPPKR